MRALADGIGLRSRARCDSPGNSGDIPLAAPQAPVAGPISVETQMNHVALHAADQIVLDIEWLRGTMISRSADPPFFDDPRSYVLQITDAEVSMSMSSLQILMNQYLLGHDGAPLKNVELTPEENGRVVMRGRLHKVPISAKAEVEATRDGRMQLRVEAMKALGVPVTGLMDLFGLTIEDVADLNRRGVEVVKNDIVIAPGQVLPPPELRGSLTFAAVVGNRLVQRFGHGKDGGRLSPLVPPDPDAPNYVYFGGGTLRFGKLTMSDADLQLIDMDPRDPFDFFPARYKAQLVAGYSKNTVTDGLKTYLPDFDDLPHVQATPASYRDRATARKSGGVSVDTAVPAGSGRVTRNAVPCPPSGPSAVMVPPCA